jgi:hypothetical protein
MQEKEKELGRTRICKWMTRKKKAKEKDKDKDED